MSVIGSFNGQSILALPSRPGLRQINLIKNDTVPSNTSPFTRTTQVLQWPGGDWWAAELTMPQLQRTDARTWSAFLGECRGSLNCFYVGDPLRQSPAGVAKGIPVVAGLNAGMSNQLLTRGWKPNVFRQLLPGDLLQIGYRLHEVLDQVDSDAGGNATVQIWPSIREAATDGEAITLKKPAGLFRLARNQRNVMTDYTRLSAVSGLQLVEAR